MANKRNNWSALSASVLKPQSVQPTKKSNFTKAAVRSMAIHHLGDMSANFRCPTCRVQFKLTYGRFGKYGMFEEPTYYCKDCSDSSKFIKIAPVQ